MKHLKKNLISLIRHANFLNRTYWNFWTIKNLIYSPKLFMVIACMPKSASTFLTTSLSLITHYPMVKLHFDRNNEKALYLPHLIKHSAYPTVTQIHLRLTNTNLQILRYFDIRPIVLVRNLYDITVSYRNHLSKEPSLNPEFRNAVITPVLKSYETLDEKEKINFIIDLVIPWYISFYVAWYYAYQSNSIDLLWINYNDIAKDSPAVIRKILDFYHIHKTDEELNISVQDSFKKDIRFNKGVSGYGIEAMDSLQIERIEKMKSYYPDVDFSLIE